MELMTARFGSVAFGTHEVIRFERGLVDRTGDRHWLMLGDQTHDSLNWLQSIAHPEIALPVVSITVYADGEPLSLPMRPVDAAKIDVRAPIIVVSPIVRSEDSISINSDMPIIIDPIRRRGVQVVLNYEQSAQHETSEQAAPLRQCA
ncbi:MAG: flagellar assembly protein FliW [Planctomycetaceae bacterium]|nr:flagellar assembly protein FliW [Planctomycetaceae bacterium]